MEAISFLLARDLKFEAMPSFESKCLLIDESPVTGEPHTLHILPGLTKKILHSEEGILLLFRVHIIANIITF